MEKIINEIKKHAKGERKNFCGKSLNIVEGGYGEGDECVGTKVPILRKIAEEYKGISDEDLVALLTHRLREARMLALFIMLKRYRGDPKKIHDMYLENISHMNNRYLVNLSAKIIGDYARETKDLSVIEAFAEENDIWKNRIAIVSTFSFIRWENFDPFFQIAEKLLGHKNVLISRAIIWGLSKIGKRDYRAMIHFMTEHDMRDIGGSVTPMSSMYRNKTKYW